MRSLDSNPVEPSPWLSTLCLNLSLVCQVLAAVFAKQAALSMSSFTPQQIATNQYYFFSIACLGLQSLAWPIALRSYPLSLAYFYMSGSYAAILVMSSWVFHEEVTITNIVGAILIVLGINIMVRAQR